MDDDEMTIADLPGSTHPLADVDGLGVVVAFDEELVEACRQLRDTRDTIAGMKTQETQLRKKILEAMIGAEEAHDDLTGALVARLKKSYRRNVDRAKLEAMYPDVFENVISESVVISIDLPK